MVVEFRGYLKAGESTNKNTDWIKGVDSFVTLGSPIDKFLIFWWQNYKYLNSAGWIGKKLKIKHFNYCDELDPVGHNLDTVATATAYKAVFDKDDDILFNRYSTPGAAHNEYWKDYKLFNWILQKAVDEKKDNEISDEPKWFIPGIYRRALMWFFKIIPYTVVGVDYLAFIWAWHSKTLPSLALATVLLVATCWLGRRVIDLTVLWRRIIVNKNRGSDLEGLQKDERNKFVSQSKCSHWIYLLLTGITWGVYFSNPTWRSEFAWGNLAIVIAVSIVAVILINKFFGFEDLEEEKKADEEACKSVSEEVKDKCKNINCSVVCALLSVTLLSGGGVAFIVWNYDFFNSFESFAPWALSWLPFENPPTCLEECPVSVEQKFGIAIFHIASFFTVAAIVFTYRYERYKCEEYNARHWKLKEWGDSRTFKDYAEDPTDSEETRQPM